MSKREIFRHGRYEMCEVLYWPEGGKPDYIIAQDAKGHELVCHQAMGAWCEMNAMDIVERLRFHDRAVGGPQADARRHHTQPETA